MRRESWEVGEKTESRIAESLSDLGEIRISEYMRKRNLLGEKRKKKCMRKKGVGENEDEKAYRHLERSREIP